MSSENIPPRNTLSFAPPRPVWAAGATLGEGICWSVREQSLWWVDILRHDAVSAAELARIALPTAHITSARFGLSEAQLAGQPLAGALFAVETEVVGQPARLFAG